MPRTLKPSLYAAASLLLCLAFSSNGRALAQTVTVDNTAARLTTGINAIPINFSNLASVGQVVTAPPGATTLESFTFIVGSFPNVEHTLKMYVYAWDGAKAQGMPLFQSTPLTIPAGDAALGLQLEEMTVNTNSLPVSPGSPYLVIFSTSEYPGQAGIYLNVTGPNAYTVGQVVGSNNGNNMDIWTFSPWVPIAVPLENYLYFHDIAFKATFGVTGPTVQELLDQVAALTTQVQALQNQLDAANGTVNNLTSQVTQLQAQLNQQSAATAALVNGVEADLRLTFNNPSFTIPGATPQQRLQNLINAISGLNKGRKEGLYQSLGGK
jgi:hypothetical protein